MTDRNQPEVIASRTGAVGRLTLNRPRALHALTHGMCDALSATLLEWRDDPSVAAVMLDHATGTRGFCAGGDVVSVRRSALEDGGAVGRAFFHAEYRLNHLLHTDPKPVIAFMEYGGDQEYYLASACDKVFLLPTASLDLTGIVTNLAGALGGIGPGVAAAGQRLRLESIKQ